jgi:hypothetical protein
MSCCGSLFVNLGGGGGGTVNTGVLQIVGGVPLDSTLRFVEDQAGTDSTLQLSTTSAKILGNVLGSGTGGGVIMGAFNATIGAIWGNVTPSSANFALAMDANFTYVNANSGISFNLAGAGGKLDVSSSGTSIGGGTNNGALTVKGASGNIVSFRDSSNVEVGNIANSGKLTINEIETTTAFSAKFSTSKTIEAIEVSGAMGLGFYNAPAIIQPVTGGSSAVYVSVSGSEIKENDTFDGYTVGGVVKALRNLGLLA